MIHRSVRPQARFEGIRRLLSLLPDRALRRALKLFAISTMLILANGTTSMIAPTWLVCIHWNCGWSNTCHKKEMHPAQRRPSSQVWLFECCSVRLTMLP